jgi:hypothetical protein
MRTGSRRDGAVTRLVTSALFVVGFATISSGCNADDSGEPGDSTAGCEGRGEAIVLGMSRTSEDGSVTISLEDVAPLPPVIGENSWTVEVTRNGEPVVDAGDADAQLIANIYMAEHDHNVRKRGTMIEPGVFEFAQFSISMNGYWEVTIQVQSDEDASDHADVVFGFCVGS